MSSATDVLLYAVPGDPGIAELRSRIAQGSRFEAMPYHVDTLKFAGPNIFMGAVLAFGADYWSWFGDEVQELLDSVTWTHPGVVVLIVRTEGHASENITDVYRPAYVVKRSGYFDSEVSAVQPAKDRIDRVRL